MLPRVIKDFTELQTAAFSIKYVTIASIQQINIFKTECHHMQNIAELHCSVYIACIVDCIVRSRQS